MAQTGFTPILLYASNTATSVPAAGNLTNSANGAEVAVNTADKRLFTKDSGGAVVELGTNPSALSVAGNVTLSGGTANGVTYLNGSKVLTSGSALTFDGTTLGSTGGAKVTGPAASLAIDGGTFDYSATVTRLAAGRAGGNYGELQLYVAGASGVTKRFSVGYDSTFSWFDPAGTGQYMTLTSTGLGIGTSSPGFKLDVNGTSRMANGGLMVQGSNLTATASQVTLDQLNSTTSRLISWGPNTATPGILSFGNLSSNASVGSASNMTLDASGNLGLGVTPSAWSGYNAFQIADAGSTPLAYIASDAAGNTVTNIGHGAYWNGSNWLYTSTSVGATRYQMTGANAGSTHAWLVSAGGTAGNAISFTQAMTLDASGNLGVGTTSPDVFSRGYGRVLGVSSASSAGIEVNAATGNSATFDLGVNGTRYAYFNATASDSFLSTAAANPLLLGTNDTERARITSGGYFKASNDGTYVGSSASYHELRVTGAAGDWNTVVANATATAANAFGIRVAYTGSAPNGTGNAFLSCDDTGATRFVARSNGGLANYSANDVNLSDRREKTNFAPAKSYLDTICAIPVQTFEYIDQSPDDPGLTLGVVAQDVQAVAPELVMESNWGTEDNPKMRLSIYQTDLQYALMKCIQELKAQNDELRARVTALESQP